MQSLIPFGFLRPAVELRHLRYFVAVADHLSFGRAAARLHISQPPLSRQVRALEEELGAPLFVRTKRSVTLTSTGAALLPEARRLLREADAIRDGARHIAAGEIGTLALGFIAVAAYSILPQLAPEFRRRHPGVRLALQEGTTDTLLSAVKQGEIDVALVLPPVDDASLRYSPLFVDTLVAALPAGRTEPRGGAISLRSLADEPFILFPRKVGSGLYDLIVSFCRRAGFSPRIEQEAIQMQTIVSLVAARMGVALVPASLRNMRRAGVVYRALTERSPPIEIGLAWRATDRAPAVQAFVAVAQAQARTQTKRKAA
jgi:DNA-binding transcriptional LysR family regulator